MKTEKDMVEVMLHFANGGEVEVKHRSYDEVAPWEPATTPSWNWASFDYRIKQPAKQKIKMLCWLSHAGYLTWGVETADIPELWIRVPSEDKEIEV